MGIVVQMFPAAKKNDILMKLDFIEMMDLVTELQLQRQVVLAFAYQSQNDPNPELARIAAIHTQEEMAKMQILLHEFFIKFGPNLQE